jgi:hypothetical protein
MYVVDPNDALFMQGSVRAFALRAAARWVKNCVAVVVETVKDFAGLGEALGPCSIDTVAEPSDQTSMR